jgi:CheY-like chemotaxis protein
MKMKILIVDDEELTRNMLSQLLIKEGYNAVSVESGEKALDLLKEEEFQIIFSDLKMPGMDGIELLKAVKSIKPHVYVIMITAYATIETAVTSMKIGAYDYIRKPFKLEQIKGMIHNIEDDMKFKQSIKEIDFLDSKSPISCYEVFKSELDKGNGIFITNDNPQGIIKEYGLEDAEFIWLTPKAEKAAEIHPQNLYKFGEVLQEFLDGHEDPIILFCNVDYLINQHEWKVVNRFLMKTSQKLISKNSRLIMSINPDEIDSEKLDELKQLISTINARFIANILSNPIRREIIRYIYHNNKTSFTSIFNNLEIDDSSKLSFHLRKLNAEKIITKNSEKKYSLRRRGQIAANILKHMETKSISDTQNLISLILD